MLLKPLHNLQNIVWHLITVLYTFFIIIKFKMGSFLPNNGYLRKFCYYFYNCKKSAVESHPLLVEAYSEHAFFNSIYRKWLQKF